MKRQVSSISVLFLGISFRKEIENQSCYLSLKFLTNNIQSEPQKVLYLDAIFLIPPALEEI